MSEYIHEQISDRERRMRGGEVKVGRERGRDGRGRVSEREGDEGRESERERGEHQSIGST